MTALKSLIILGVVASATCQHYGGGSSSGGSYKGGHGTSYVAVTRHISSEGYKGVAYGGHSYESKSYGGSGGSSSNSESKSYGGSSGGSSYGGGSSGGTSYGGYKAVSYQSQGKGESKGYGGGSSYSKSESKSYGGGSSYGGSSGGSSYGGHKAVSYQSNSQGKGESQAVSHGYSKYEGGSSESSYGHEEKVFDYYAKPQYKFEYKIEDPHTGDVKSQQETREGDSVKGVYELKEPDGTILEVHYVADKKNGFNAEVIRKGKAQHPEHEYKKSHY